jgi:hypothetical protein
MYEVRSASLVCPKNGLAAADVGGVDAGPPPHWAFGAGWQPGVVGVIVAVLATLPAPDTTPVTV